MASEKRSRPVKMTFRRVGPVRRCGTFGRHKKREEACASSPCRSIGTPLVVDCRSSKGLSNFVRFRFTLPVGSGHRPSTSVFLYRHPCPEAVGVYLQGPRLPFESPPVVRPFLAEPGRGDMPSTTWALSAFCYPVAFRRVGLPAVGFHLTGDTDYSSAGRVSTGQNSNLESVSYRLSYEKLASN